MQEMSARQVYEYLETTPTKPLLLDVRENWEYNICHIKGAELIPMKMIPAQIEQLDPNQEIIVICHHGVRSRMVGRFLEQAEFTNVTNLTGGVAAWAQTVDRSMSTYL